MFLSGIADEAGKSIEVQIKAHQELGWSHIEIRNVEGTNLVDLGDGEFADVYDKVVMAGMTVSCFASQLCNWARKISHPFEADQEELKRAIPRLQRFGCKFIRCMSYPNDERPEPEWRKEVFRRLHELVKVAEDGGVVLLHENCDGWGGLSPENTLALLGEMNSPHFRLVYDTGNPLWHGLDPGEFYRKVKDAIAYVHIKDGRRKPGGEAEAAYCGEGEGKVAEVISDLLASGYRGGFSIEPHLASVIHEGKEGDSEVAYKVYVEYGRRLAQLVKTAAGNRAS